MPTIQISDLSPTRELLAILIPGYSSIQMVTVNSFRLVGPNTNLKFLHPQMDNSNWILFVLGYLQAPPAAEGAAKNPQL